MDLDVASFSHFLSLLLFVFLKYFGAKERQQKRGSEVCKQVQTIFLRLNFDRKAIIKFCKYFGLV
jgi:hypothetical protein